MEMTRVRWEESMMARCLARCKNSYTAKPVDYKAEKPVALADKPLPKAKYWDDFMKAIDIASRK